MKPRRLALLSCLAALVVAAFFTMPAESRARKRTGVDRAAAAEAVNPAYLAMLGTAAPPSRVEWFGSKFLLAGEERQPVFAALKNVGTPAEPRYEASGLELDVQTHYGPVRIGRARVVLSPSADGRKCRFELSGAPLATAAALEASGTIEWAAGPAGGDKLDGVVRAGAVPFEALRAAFPNRFDPSLRGDLELSGKVAGVVGESTTEDAPATPLRGELHAKGDWQILGRVAPAELTASFSLDDKMVRVNSGQLAWQTHVLPIKGWFDPGPVGQFDLRATFSDVDTAKVAAEWNVPEAWRPASSLSGTFSFGGKPGKGMLRYEASAASLALPALGGWNVRLDGPRLKGGLLEINADVAVSVRSGGVHVGGISLGALPVGVKWWENKLTLTSANTALWGGESDASASYVPSEHPKFTFSGRVRNAVATELVSQVAPQLGLDVDGAAAAAYSLGRDAAGATVWAAHASLTSGRLGGVDLFTRTLEALAAADPALRLPDAASLVPTPRSGAGTRVDRLFFELARDGETYGIGGLYLRAGMKDDTFHLDADGRYSSAAGLSLEGTMALPPSIAERLVASAPWLAPLRIENASLYVPVVVRGKPSALELELAPGYADTLARARRGEAVEATRAREVRHVGPQGLAIIPGDPAAADLL